MKCPHCGYETYNNEIKCPHCGEFMLKKDEEEIEKSPSKKETPKTQSSINTTDILILLTIISSIIAFLCLLINTNKENPFIILTVIIIVILTITLWLSTKIKDIVVSVGRTVLDFGTSLNVVCSVLIIIIGFFQCKDEYGNIEGFIWAYIGGAILFFLITLLADYTLYLLIDIRDSLKKLANKSDEK